MGADLVNKRGGAEDFNVLYMEVFVFPLNFFLVHAFEEADSAEILQI